MARENSGRAEEQGRPHAVILESRSQELDGSRQ
jgi:hypothetical protein